MTATTNPFIGVEELAERWGVDRKTILFAIGRGEVPCTKLGRRFLIPVAWVEMQERTTVASG